MDSNYQEEKMRKAYLALLSSFIMTSGCGVTQADRPPQKTGKNRTVAVSEQKVQYLISEAGTGPTAPNTKAFSIYNAIARGMSEDDMANLVKDVTLESGTIATTANERRVYFKVGPNTQFWIELKGDMHPYVTRKGPLEAKSRWRRFPNNFIEIESANIQ